MSQRMLIDARHPEETRVAVVTGTRIEEFDFEAAERRQLKGNIYLAKVTRVEPSLQAAFIDYGGNRHGFLAFSEIHPDYYQIPREDREALLREEAELAAEDHHDEPEVGEDGEEIAVTGGGDDAGSDVLRRQRQALRRRYKIQEVIRRRQVILVQVVKEERGNKGAALTTYLSLAGRFCVLMPNTAHGGGISRKISNLSDRKRLKQVMADLQLPAGMGAIVRTAGLKRTRAEIKRDFDYLTRLWDEIRETTLASVAPCLVHQDSDLIKRAIRDIYSRDIEQVLVDGPDGFTAAQTFMQLLMPSHAAKVVAYTDAVPLFQRFGVEASLAGMYQPVVQLKSGGYIVINPTEALVSIDVNSGRSTREHGIEETAYKTNLEAADEIGRQLRLRDMAGLVVIDFIDMEVGGNNRRVERAMKEAMKHDRARIQLGRISSFGLMEMSRQRLRTGVLEASTHVCPMCDGSGYVRSVGSAALAALRALEAEAIKGKNSSFQLRAGLEVAMYILNRKRADVVELEERYGVDIETIPDETLMGPNFVLDAAGPPPASPVVMTPLPPVVAIDDDDELPAAADSEPDEDDDEAEPEARSERGRPGRGRRGRTPRDATPDDGAATADAADDTAGETAEDVSDDADDGASRPPRADGTRSEARDGREARDGERGRGRRRRRRGGRDRRPEGDAPGTATVAAGEPLADIASNADVLVTGSDAAEIAAGYDPAATAGDGVASLTTAGSGDAGSTGDVSRAADAEGDIRRRRRGRRGGRRREGGPVGPADVVTDGDIGEALEANAGDDAVADGSGGALTDDARSDGRTGAPPTLDSAAAGGATTAPDGPAPAASATVDTLADAVDATGEGAAAKKPRRSRAKKPDLTATEPVAAAGVPETTGDMAVDAPKPRRARRKPADAAADVDGDPAAAAAPLTTSAIVAEPDAFVATATIVDAATGDGPADATDAPAAAGDAPPAPANDAAPAAPRKGGWWQRTFGN